MPTFFTQLSLGILRACWSTKIIFTRLTCAVTWTSGKGRMTMSTTLCSSPRVIRIGMNSCFLYHRTDLRPFCVSAGQWLLCVRNALQKCIGREVNDNRMALHSLHRSVCIMPEDKNRCQAKSVFSGVGRRCKPRILTRLARRRSWPSWPP